MVKQSLKKAIITASLSGILLNVFPFFTPQQVLANESESYVSQEVVSTFNEESYPFSVMTPKEYSDILKLMQEHKNYTAYQEVQPVTWEMEALVKDINKLKFKDEIYFYHIPNMLEKHWLHGFISHVVWGNNKGWKPLIVLDSTNPSMYRTLYHEYAHFLMYKFQNDEYVQKYYNEIDLDLHKETLTDILTTYLMLSGKTRNEMMTLKEVFTQFNFSYMKKQDFINTYKENVTIMNYVNELLMKEYDGSYVMNTRWADNVVIDLPNQPAIDDLPIEEPVETPVVETPVVEIPVIETPVVEIPVIETPVIETPEPQQPVEKPTTTPEPQQSVVVIVEDKKPETPVVEEGQPTNEPDENIVPEVVVIPEPVIEDNVDLEETLLPDMNNQSLPQPLEETKEEDNVKVTSPITITAKRIPLEAAVFVPEPVQEAKIEGTVPLQQGILPANILPPILTSIITIITLGLVWDMNESKKIK